MFHFPPIHRLPEFISFSYSLRCLSVFWFGVLLLAVGGNQTDYEGLVLLSGDCSTWPFHFVPG